MTKLNLDQHISRQFNEDLEGIKTQMLEMGGLVSRQVSDSIKSLCDGNSELAETVLRRENHVDKYELDIDEACTTIIARRQPAASDLRMILAVIKAVRDLERIGDKAGSVAKLAVELTEQGTAPGGYMEIRHIGNSVQDMLDKALDAFARYDADLAVTIMNDDQQVDLEYKTAMRELITYMMEDPRTISRVLNIIWVLRALERVGDHSKNIAEHIVFLVKGKDIRHQHAKDD